MHDIVLGMSQLTMLHKSAFCYLLSTIFIATLCLQELNSCTSKHKVNKFQYHIIIDYLYWFLPTNTKSKISPCEKRHM